MTDLGPRPTMSTARAAELIGTTAKNVAAMWRAGELGGGTPSAPVPAPACTRSASTPTRSPPTSSAPNRTTR